MIGSLRGTLLDAAVRVSGKETSGEILVEAGAVGYRVVVAASLLSGLGAPGSQVFLHVHTHVREDAVVLFGFGTREERKCFEALIAAHGVGPSVALSILSVHSPKSLMHVLAEDDVDALTSVPGIGKKTAARLLVELKARIDLPTVDLLAGTSSEPEPADGSGRSSRSEVRAALAGLGYGADEVREVLRELPSGETTETQLRHALRQLAGMR